MAAASVNASAPALVELIPISSAPTRLTAVALRALPWKVRLKNQKSAAIARTVAAITSIDWPVICNGPTFHRCSLNGAIREPSGPNRTRPMLAKARCTATEIIRSTRTDPWATG